MEYRLDELFDLQMGKTPARKNPEYWNSNDHKWISIADLSKCEKYITETKEHISSIAVQESGISEIPANTVIMSFKLSIGKTAITKEPIYSNEAIMSFRDKGMTPLLPDYIYYMFSGRDWSKGSNTAVMGTTLNKATLSQIRIYVHAYEDQKRIVDLLDKVSSIISKREQELVELDDLIKARFVEMFGTEREFERWSCCTIGDVAKVGVGVVIKPTQYYTDDGIPAFRSLNIGEMKVKDNDWVYFTEEGHKKNQKSVVKTNDVLVVRSGAPGTACVATEKYNGYNAVDIIIAHPDQDKVNSVFLAAFTNMPHGMNQIKGGTGGAAQQHFNVSGYKAMTLIMPPMRLQEKFADFVAQIDKSKLLSGCRLFHSWAPENRDKPKHVGVPQRKTKVLRGGRRQQ